jgi:hypothetical protein
MHLPQSQNTMGDKKRAPGQKKNYLELFIQLKIFLKPDTAM